MKIKTLPGIVAGACCLAVLGIFVVRHAISSRTNTPSTPTSSISINGKGAIRQDYPFTARHINLSTTLSQQPVPTNTWWVSALTGSWPDTLFPLPFAAQLNATGMSIGVPTIVAAADNVTSQFQPDIQIALPDVTLDHSQVQAYDTVSVSIGALDRSNHTAAVFRFVKGSPIQYFTTSQPFTVTAGSNSSWTVGTTTDNRPILESTVRGHTYLLYLHNQPVQQAPGKYLITPQGETVYALAALPDKQLDHSLFDQATITPLNTVSYRFTTDATASHTIINWGQTTLFLILPHQQSSSSATNLGTYQTIRGTAFLAQGSELDATYLHTSSLDQIPLAQDDAFFQKSQLLTYLSTDANTAAPAPNGIYDAGKELFRLANLYDIAQQAASPEAPVFGRRLANELEDWLTYTPGKSDHYFAYDSTVRGLIAIAPQYGNEEYNDHHFHYGYFLYAAAILGKYDQSFVHDYGSTIDLLAEDIASPTANSFAATLRTVDLYEGHSWAGGLARFGDGNDQESVSEAINAWYGLHQWGVVRGNTEQVHLGQWLYDQEVTAAKTYWFGGANLPAGYQHNNVSLIWAGKADWATWFSAKPEAKHMILYLPLSGGSLYLEKVAQADRAALDKELHNLVPSESQDIFLMTKALYDPQGAQKDFATYMSSNHSTDSSNSLPYLYAWLGWAGQRSHS